MKLKKIFNMKKLRTWYWEKEVKSRIVKLTKYRFDVHLITGEVVRDCMTSSYYRGLMCTIGEYLLIKSDGLTIEGKFYPREAIKYIEETGVQKEYVYCHEEFLGLFGLSEKELEENQKKYSKELTRYKKEESEKNGRNKNSRIDS